MAFATLASIVYLAIASYCLWRFTHRAASRQGVHRPPVTILKPVCGIDYDSYENLRSFCCQDYENCQVVFGVREQDDPVIHVIRRLIDDFPERDISVVVDDRTIGANLKISNLANMYRVAKHDILIIADSDIHVGPDYVASVVAAFEGRNVGVVTCLYRARTADGLASRLSGLSINEWFLPSALVAVTLQGLRFCFGSTMAVRRDVLMSIGGFERLAAYLADDHMLGKLAMQRGYKIRLSTYLVENVVHERSLRTLFDHELRWARTIRSIQPIGHAFSFTTYAVTLALLTALLAVPLDGSAILAGGLLLAAFLMRYAMHRIACSALGLSGAYSPPLVAMRDVMSATVWLVSLFGSRVRWKGWTMAVGRNGHLLPKTAPST
ncbi:MAG: bacteriohopanetetrol glucosamine biosynthesis glycosyltransferase HpnI [Alphaproteobacteria bacterium]|nr:bacteriohopanetetrol glucosamine biosynthesis glycosyltransferase HpnI [Alphaproteobacteria bacterium]